MLDGNVDHACQLAWKTVKLHSFWCNFYSNFYSFNKWLLMTIKIASPSPHPCSLPGNKSDFSSSQHCRKEMISKIQPWYHFAAWTHSHVIEPVHLVKNKFFSLRGILHLWKQTPKGLNSSGPLEAFILPWLGLSAGTGKMVFEVVSPLNTSLLLHGKTALWLTPITA